MLSAKIQVKLYAGADKKSSLESYIPVFHKWVRENTLDEMVFDVADYTHVPHGTGVLLVGHASDYSLDQGEGRPGLVYYRKREAPDGNALVADGLARALKAAKLLDADADVRGPKSFGTKEVLFRFTDRLRVTNDESGFQKVKPAIEAALAELLPQAEYALVREGEAREPLTVRAKA